MIVICMTVQNAWNYYQGVNQKITIGAVRLIIVKASVANMHALARRNVAGGRFTVSHESSDPRIPVSLRGSAQAVKQP